jgi:hypothetical protein
VHKRWGTSGSITTDFMRLTGYWRRVLYKVPKEYRLLRCDAVWLLYEQTFRRNCGFISQKMAFFLVTAVKISNLT